MISERQQRQIGKMSMQEQVEMRQGLEDQQKFHELIREHMSHIAERKATFTGASHILLAFITAPLFTISASMQLSINSNAVTMQEFRSKNNNIRSFHERMSQLGQKSIGVDSSVRFGFLQ